MFPIYTPHHHCSKRRQLRSNNKRREGRAGQVPERRSRAEQAPEKRSRAE
jgi:hypothetical protein